MDGEGGDEEGRKEEKERRGTCEIKCWM